MKIESKTKIPVELQETAKRWMEMQGCTNAFVRRLYVVGEDVREKHFLLIRALGATKHSLIVEEIPGSGFQIVGECGTKKEEQMLNEFREKWRKEQ